jgi:hypothetical protein
MTAVAIKIRLKFKMMAPGSSCRRHSTQREKPNVKFMIELVLVPDTLATNLAGTYELSDCSEAVFIHNTFKLLVVPDGEEEGLEGRGGTGTAT